MRPRMCVDRQILELWRSNPRLVALDPNARSLFQLACQALIEELDRDKKEWVEIRPPLQYEVSA